MSKLAALGVVAMASIDLLPPTRQYSGEEMARALASVNAEAVLLVTLKDAFSSQTYVPGSTTTTGSAWGTGTGGVNWSATTQENPGYYIRKPRVEFETRLLDSQNGATLWMSTSLTRGNAFARWDTLMYSLAREVVNSLTQEQLLGAMQQ